jgi:copper resistance protein B
MNRIALLAASLLATPALAQGSMAGMPGMAAPAKASSKPAAHDMKSMPGMKVLPPAAASEPAGHDMAGMAGMPGMAASAKTPAKPAAHDMASMPGMQMPSTAAADPHAGHDAAAMPGMVMPGQPAAPGAAPAADAHAGHDMSSMPGMPGMAMPQAQKAAPADAAIPQTPPPPVPTDHLADRYFDPAAMAAARQQLSEEHGGAAFSKVMANLLEYRAQPGGGYRWDGEAFYGGDIDRFVVKTEGAGNGRTGLESAEAQALYSHAVGRYFDLQAGVRQDFAPGGRTYLTVGTQGLLPYWFDVAAAVFVSTRGEVLGRVEGTYDLRLTQRWVLQPRAELNFAAQDTRQTRTGSGLSDAELGLRLRYEIKREFAPYVGLSYERKVGRTATFARQAGEDIGGPALVLGIRAWF